jgi:hypothetical protein
VDTKVSDRHTRHEVLGFLSGSMVWNGAFGAA